MKMKLIFFGAGPNQISYVKNSFKKNNYNIVIHNDKTPLATKYSNIFFLGSVYDKKQVLNICRKLKKDKNIINDIVCRSSGPSIISAAAAFDYFNLRRVNFILARCIYSKHYFSNFLKKKKIPVIKSVLINKNKKEYPQGKWVFKPDAPIYGKMFIHKIDNQKLSENNFKTVKKNSHNKKVNLSEFVPGNDITAVFFIEKKRKKLFLLNLVNEWNFFYKNKMNLFNKKSVPGLSTPELFIKPSEKKKIINYSKKIISYFPSYYGLMSLSFRISKNKVYAYEININIEKRYSDIIFPGFYKNKSLYDMEIDNLMNKKITLSKPSDNKKFIGILGDKEILCEKEYSKKIKKFMKS